MIVFVEHSYMYVLDGTVSESDEISVSDPDKAMNRNEMRQALRNANLEEIGFNRTIEFSTSIDENGRRRKTTVIRYMVKDKCSKSKEWQEKLEKRLPSNFFSSSVSQTFARDVGDRVGGRPTKYCFTGLEMTSTAPPQHGVRGKRGWIRVRIGIRIEINLKAKIKF